MQSLELTNLGKDLNDAIFKFKRYEDSSLSYTGIDKHHGEDIGGRDTVILREEYEKLFFNQQATMDAPEREELVEEKEEFEPVAVPVMVTPQAPTPKAVPSLVTKSYGIVSPIPAATTPKTVPQQQAEKPAVDKSMLVVGAIVHHKVFGDGEIIKVDKAATHITVKFKVGEKPFIVDGGTYCAFKNGFLKF